MRYERPAWVATRTKMVQNSFRRRSDIVLNQFKARGWMALGQGVEFHVDGTPQYGGHIAAGGLVTMTAAEGIIYYTSDGSDPRLPGGTLSPTAKTLPGNGVPVNSAVQLQARLQLADGSWGPLSSAKFTNAVPADASILLVSEVESHPARTSDT